MSLTLKKQRKTKVGKAFVKGKEGAQNPKPMAEVIDNLYPIKQALNKVFEATNSISNLKGEPDEWTFSEEAWFEKAQKLEQRIELFKMGITSFEEILKNQVSLDKKSGSLLFEGWKKIVEDLVIDYATKLLEKDSLSASFFEHEKEYTSAQTEIEEISIEAVA